MPFLQLTFTPLDSLEEQACAEETLWEYLACLYKNGQILEDFTLIRQQTGYRAFVTLPADDALEEKHNNVYVAASLAAVRRRFCIAAAPYGDNCNAPPACACTQPPAWYLLRTESDDEGSPVVCGRCGCGVPLYRLPTLPGQAEYFDILTWKKDYRCVDRLFLSCLADRFTYRQLHDPRSQLSQAGRALCRQLEEATGRPVYYFLYHHDRTSKTCPVCGREWTAAAEGSPADRLCDTCRLAVDAK